MKNIDENQIKDVFKPFLWSYDIEKIDIKKNKKIIILNVLNYGTKKATDLLFDVYDKKEIEEIVEKSAQGEWNKKSLNYWKLFLNLKGENKNRLENVL